LALSVGFPGHEKIDAHTPTTGTPTSACFKNRHCLFDGKPLSPAKVTTLLKSLADVFGRSSL
jgi:hypothetical protein